MTTLLLLLTTTTNRWSFIIVVNPIVFHLLKNLSYLDRYTTAKQYRKMTQEVSHVKFCPFGKVANDTYRVDL